MNFRLKPIVEMGTGSAPPDDSFFSASNRAALMQKLRELFLLTLLLTFAGTAPAWASGFNASLASNDELMGILSSTIGPAINTVTGQGNGTVSMVTKALMDLNDLVLILGGLI